jgi:uncharacterized protein (TIGR03435 family)
MRCLVVALIMMALADGQAFAPTGAVKFEVGTIKPTAPDNTGWGVFPTYGGKRYIGSGMTLKGYLVVAYQVKAEQIRGGPVWADDEPFDLNAEAEKSSSLEDLHIMLQNLLTEQFKLQFHYETKVMRAHILMEDKNGQKNLTLHPRANGGDVILDQVTDQVHEKWYAHCASLNFFSWRLSQLLDLPVVNQTGLDGCFNFEISFTRELPLTVQETKINGVPVDPDGPTIHHALPQQLGLKLEEQKAPVETMVIDHAERPTEE